MMNLGALDIARLTLGSSDIARIYMGSQRIFPIESNLIPGFQYLDIDVRAAGDAVVETDDIWTIPSYTSGSFLQPQRRFTATYGQVAFKNNPFSDDTSIQVKDSNALDATARLNVFFDGATLKYSIDGAAAQTMAIQPTTAEHVVVMFGDQQGDDTVAIRIGVFTTYENEERGGTTVTVPNLVAEDTVIQFAIANSASKIYYPQGKALANATATTAELTIVVDGLDDSYEVAVNDVVWTDNKKSFPIGTRLENLVVTATGWDIDPLSIDSVTMDIDKTLTFTASQAVDTNLLPGYTYMNLPLADYTTLDNKIWTQKVAFGSYNPLGYRFSTNSSVLIQWQNDGYSDGPELSVSQYTVANQRFYMWVTTGGVINFQLDSETPAAVTAVPGTYYGYLRVGTNIKGVSTTDGVTFTTIYDFGNIASQAENLVAYRYNNTMNKWYYPQGKDLIIT